MPTAFKPNWLPKGPATIEHTVPSEPVKALQIEDIEKVVHESIFHPMKALEDVIKTLEIQNKLLQEVINDNLIKRQYHDDFAQLGATLNYRFVYHRHTYVYIYSTTAFTLSVSDGSSQAIPANYYTLLNYPEGVYMTVSGGSDTAPILCRFRSCDVPLEPGTQQVQGGFLEQTGLSAGALNADLVPSTDVSAYKWFSVQITGTWSGTLSFQGSNDNVNFMSIPMYRSDTATNSSTNIVSTNLLVSGPVTFRYLRVRMTAYTSGTANGTLELYTQNASLWPGQVQAIQSGTWTVQPGNTPNTTPWLVNQSSDYPSGSTPITADSGNQANATATATLAANATQRTWITGFLITSSGATGASVVTGTITGVVTGTLHFTYTAVAGATLADNTLAYTFSKPIPSSAINTAIAVSIPALGAGNTNTTVNAFGYQLT